MSVLAVDEAGSRLDLDAIFDYAPFVRYAGEGHLINNRANVLDMWKRITAWLAETMPPRN